MRQHAIAAVFLCACSTLAATNLNLRRLDYTNNVRFGSQQSREMVWYRGESVQYNAEVWRDSERVELPAGASIIWQAWKSNNLSVLYISATGEVVDASLGQVRASLTPAQANLASGVYNSALSIWGGTNYVGIAGAGSIRVLWTPAGDSVPYVGASAAAYVPKPTNTWTAGYVISSSDGGTTTYAVAQSGGGGGGSGTLTNILRGAGSSTRLSVSNGAGPQVTLNFDASGLATGYPFTNLTSEGSGNAVTSLSFSAQTITWHRGTLSAGSESDPLWAAVSNQFQFSTNVIGMSETGLLRNGRAFVISQDQPFLTTDQDTGLQMDFGGIGFEVRRLGSGWPQFGYTASGISSLGDTNGELHFGGIFAGDGASISNVNALTLQGISAGSFATGSPLYVEAYTGGVGVALNAGVTNKPAGTVWGTYPNINIGTQSAAAASAIWSYDTVPASPTAWDFEFSSALSTTATETVTGAWYVATYRTNAFLFVTNDALVVQQVGPSPTDSWSSISQALPAPPWRFECKTLASGISNLMYAGIALMETNGGRGLHFVEGRRSGGASTPELRVQSFNRPGSVQNIGIATLAKPIGAWPYFAIEYQGAAVGAGSINFEASQDGLSWLQIGVASAANPFGLGATVTNWTRIGIAWDWSTNAGGTNDFRQAFQWFRRTK